MHQKKRDLADRVMMKSKNTDEVEEKATHEMIRMIMEEWIMILIYFSVLI